MISPIDHGHLRGFMHTPEQNCICGIAHSTRAPQYQCTRQWPTHQSRKNNNRDDTNDRNDHHMLGSKTARVTDSTQEVLNNRSLHQYYRAPLVAHTSHRTPNTHDTRLQTPPEESVVEQREPQVSRSNMLGNNTARVTDSIQRVPMARHTDRPINTYHRKAKAWARGNRTKLPETTRRNMSKYTNA